MARLGVLQPSLESERSETVDLRDIRVLVVDDNETNLRFLQGVLLRWHMKPELADGGEAALAALEKAIIAGQEFRLVLTDRLMPVMDGFTLAEHIRLNPLLAGADLLMLTSAGQRGDAARCRALGISAYLTKPIRQSDLLEAIRPYFPGRQLPPRLRAW